MEKVLIPNQLQPSYFQQPCIQNFSFPECIIHYIAKNPLTSEGYLKLINSCKYFFPRNRIIVIKKLESCNKAENIWKAFAKIGENKEYIKLDLQNNIFPFKIWLTGELNICEKLLSRNSLNLLLEKVYRCEVTSLYLNKHDISWTEFELLTASKKVTHLALEEMVIKDENENGMIIPFERILEKVPNVSYCAYNIEENPSLVYTCETAKNMAALPPFKNLKYLHILQNSDQFDPNDFCDFIKKNHSQIDYLITFHEEVPMEYKRWFKFVFDRMLDSWEEEGKNKPSNVSVSLLF